MKRSYLEKKNISGSLSKLATSLGFDIVGFAEAAEFINYPIENSKRRDPKLTLPDAKSIIVVGIYIGGIVLPWEKSGIARTSRLLLSGFFNDIVKQLEPFVDFLHKEGYEAVICDDSEKGESILPLKLSAVRAGLGWQGKNSLLINKKFGSFLALGGILTNAELEHGLKVEKNRCRSCNKCQQACQMNALEESYVLNKNRCLSYLFLKDEFPEEAKLFIENRIIDCEICQYACPWNQKHIKQPLNTSLTKTFKLNAAKWETFFSISNLLKLTETEYYNKLGLLNIDIPYKIFHRNIEMAAGKK